MSLVLRPESFDRLNLLPAITSLAVTDLLLEFGIRAQIKWPNDVTVDGRKIAGILCESSIRGDRIEWIIVGIGVNVNNPPPQLRSTDTEYPATSMIEHRALRVDLAKLALLLQARIIQLYSDLARGRGSKLLREYNSRHSLKERRVVVKRKSEAIDGIAGNVDAEGKLEIKMRRGKLRRVRAEDVVSMRLI